MFFLCRPLLNHQTGFGKASSSTTNLYKLLRVKRGSSPKEIKQAFITLAKQYHPDNKSEGDQEIFKELNEAYKVLSDPVKRAEYDFELQQEENSFQFEEQRKAAENDFSMFDQKQRVRTINMTEEEKIKFVQMMAKRKKENMDNLRKTQEHMFVDLRKNKRNPLKLILVVVGAAFLLWGFKIGMFYNSVYKNWKGTDEIIDVVHPLANDAEGEIHRNMAAPENIKNMLIQNQKKEYINNRYYKQNPPQRSNDNNEKL